MRSITELLQEMFGEPIGDYAGDVPAGAPDIRAKKESNVCPKCGMKNCQCDHVSEAEECGMCGFMEVEGSCGCTHEMSESKKKKGPSKKALKGLFKGAETFKDKVKISKGIEGIKDPEAFSAWASREIGEDPRKKK